MKATVVNYKTINSLIAYLETNIYLNLLTCVITLLNLINFLFKGRIKFA